MAVESSDSQVSYDCDGSTTVFAVPFYFLLSTDLSVSLVAADGTITPVTGGYEVSGAGSSSGGSITTDVAYAVGLQLVISRLVPLTQETKYQSNSAFPAKTQEKAYDKTVMIDQQQQRSIARSIQFPDVDTSGASPILPTVPVRANKQLFLDGAGNIAVSTENFIEPSGLLSLADVAAAARDSQVLTAANGYSVAQDSVTLIIAKSYTDALLAAGSPNGSGIFIQDGAGMVGRAINAKLKDTVSLLDGSAVAPGLVSNQTVAFGVVDIVKATIRVPRGTHQVTSAITLKGHYTFEYGALVQPAAGVAITHNNAYIEAPDQHQIFDLSAGGTVTGKILNEYHSVCWFGADPTFTNLSGTSVQKAIDSALTRKVQFPYGKYDMTGTQIKQAGVHVSARNWQPGIKFSSGTLQDSPTLKWRTDMGAGAIQWQIMSYNTVFPGAVADARAFDGVSLSGLYMEGPIPSSIVNGYAPAVQHDGISLGSGGNVQMHLENVTVSYTRYAYTAWSSNGHSTFRKMRSFFNLASWYLIQTGGDWSWEGKCISGGDQLATFLAPRNGSFGADPSIEYFYTAGVPYFFRQTTTLDSRGATQITQPFAIGGTFDFLSVETLGNAFAWLEPSDSSFFLTHFRDVRWVAPNPSSYAGIPSDPSDYAFKCASLNSCTFFGSQTGGGIGLWAAGSAGVFNCSVSNSSKLLGYTSAGSPVMTSPLQNGLVKAFAYADPAINFAAGQQTQTYTMAADEAASARFLAPRLVVRNASTNIGSKAVISGSTVVITLDSAVAGGGFLQGTLIMYGSNSGS